MKFESFPQASQQEKPTTEVQPKGLNEYLAFLKAQKRSEASTAIDRPPHLDRADLLFSIQEQMAFEEYLQKHPELLEE